MPRVICRLVRSLIVLLSLNRKAGMNSVYVFTMILCLKDPQYQGERSDGMERKMARPGGLELPTFWFVARRSIQLSYGRAVNKYYHRLARRIQPPQEFTFCTRKAS